MSQGCTRLVPEAVMGPAASSPPRGARSLRHELELLPTYRRFRHRAGERPHDDRSAVGGAVLQLTSHPAMRAETMAARVVDFITPPSLSVSKDPEPCP